MRRLAPLVLVLAGAAHAERELVGFRLRKDPMATARGWAVDASAEGFTLEHFGGGRRQFVPWTEIVEEDALAMRRQLGVAPPGEAAPPPLAGHRLYLAGGATVDGLLVRIDEEGRHWVKSGGALLPYPRDRVERVESIEVAEGAVYDEQEAYFRRLIRTPPSTPVEHRHLADHLFALGNFEKAALHYEEACRARPEWRANLRARLEEVADLLADKEAAEAIRKARHEALYNGRHDLARRLLEDYVRTHPGSERRALLVLDDLAERRQEALRRAFHRVKSEELDQAVRRFLVKRKPDIGEAMDFAASGLAAEVAAATRARLGLGEGDYEALRQTPTGGAPHWATYWSGSFVLSRRAKVGSSTRANPVGDPDRWWGQYDDVNTRATWLKAYAAERLPDLFEVVQVVTTPCDRCGGKGQVRKMSFRSVAGPGRNEWMETCPRCWGAREDRAVAYR